MVNSIVWDIYPLPKCHLEYTTTTTTTTQSTTTTTANLDGIEGECDPSIPHVQHDASCKIFYHCTRGLYGQNYQLVEKQCGPGTMYNPSTMICDWPQSVYLVRPDCFLGRIKANSNILVSGHIFVSFRRDLNNWGLYNHILFYKKEHSFTNDKMSGKWVGFNNRKGHHQ